MNYTIWIMIIYAVLMIGSTILFTKKEKDIKRFCVGERNSGIIATALSIAATWIWAPALFTSTENAYTRGLAGLFWFLVPNVLCLLLFIPFAKKIRRKMPEGITLSGYMHHKYGSAARNVYLFQLVALSALSTGVQLLAGSKILSFLTGMPFPVMTLIMSVIAFSYSQFSGIKASMLTDAIQMAFMLVASIAFAILGFRNGGGIQTISAGLGSIAADGSRSLFSGKGLEIFLGFGLPTTVGLISGPFGDQSFWQRAFAVKEDKSGKSFLLGAFLFAIVPLSMGILGFLAAGLKMGIKDPGLANFEIISRLLPARCIAPFLFMIISGLLSTIDSNLCAVSSLTTDVFKRPTVQKTKAVMVLFLVFGIVVANIPELTVTHLFLFYGTLRASTLLPTVMSLMKVRLSEKGIAAGVISALCIGLPVFAYGNIQGLALYKTTGSLLTVLLSGTVSYIVSNHRKEVKA